MNPDTIIVCHKITISIHFKCLFPQLDIIYFQIKRFELYYPGYFFEKTYWSSVFPAVTFNEVTFTSIELKWWPRFRGGFI